MSLDGDGPRTVEDNVATERPAGISRRRFLQFSGAAAAAGAVAATNLLAAPSALASPKPAGAPSPESQRLAPKPGEGVKPPSLPEPGRSMPRLVGADVTTTPVRPPAAPLAVRQPYLSTWLPATVLPGTWESFWAGQTTAMGGIVRIDGSSYMFAGDPGIILSVPNGNNGSPSTVQGFEAALDQTLLEVTATRSRFTLQGAGVSIVVEFFSPVEPGDPMHQSVPMSYVLVSAQSIDGNSHSVQVYMDISGEWCSGDRSQTINWAPSTVSYPNGTLQTWSVQLSNQQVLAEQNQQAAWGTVVWATPQRSGLTYQSGQDVVVRAQFVQNGALANTNDTDYRAINDNWPVFAFATDLGSVGSSTQKLQYSIGQVRSPALSYLGQSLQPLWSKYWPSSDAMLGAFHADLAAAETRADALDARISNESQAAGGASYEALCVLSLRQAYGGTELVVGPTGTPWAFLKEISSDGDTSTVDVLFPASPLWVYLDPQYLAMLLEPLLAYAESGQWTQPFAEHDLGAYPNATGYPNGGGENMPVEETANMLIMAAAYAKAAPGFVSTAFLNAHYTTLANWANYLTQNLPDPGFQNQTDDFAGPIAHSVNLAVKGIVGVAAMGQIASAVGNTSDASNFTQKAQSYMSYWLTNSQDPSGQHLDLTYNGSDGGDGTWGTTYNAYSDTLLGTGLIPQSVLAEQANWYTQVSNQFGLPLQVPHSYTKGDWEMWVAAWLRDYPIKNELIAREYAYANNTAQRVPFSDLYDTISGNQVGFQARPVVGGIFALLALPQGTSAPYNNTGISSDSYTAGADLDGVGFSYSATALSDAGVTPGSTVSSNGFSFTWPDVSPGSGDNYQAAGQTVGAATPAGAASLGILGVATNAGTSLSSGTVTVHYSDGSTSTASLSFPDWCLGGGGGTVPSGTTEAVKMGYRNAPNGPQTINTYVFATSIPISSSKTVTSVTLPTSGSNGDLHIFALA